MKNTTRLFLMLFFSASILASCKKKDDPTPPPAPAPAAVKFVHAVPPGNFTNFDLFVNNVQFNTAPFVFRSHIPDTAYRFYEPGALGVRVTPSGFPTTNVYNNAVGIEAGRSYTIFLHDTSSVRVTAINDNLTPPSVGKVHVRYIQMAPDVPATARLEINGVNISSNINYGNASQFIPIDAANNQTIRLMFSTAELAKMDNVNLINGKIYSMWVSGRADNSTLALNVIQHN